MKKFQQLLCLLPILGFLTTARAQFSSNITTPTASSPAAPVSSAAAANAAPRAIDPAKEAEIRKLLELTGTGKITQQFMDRMISSFKMQNAGVSSEFWDRFEKEMNMQYLIDKIVPIYAKYYSLDDLRAINAFYQTPIGHKVLATTPLIMHESMQIGRDWGRQAETKLISELQKEKAKAAASAPAPASAPQ